MELDTLPTTGRHYSEKQMIGKISTMDNLSGSVERITFYNSENGYTVLRLKPDQRGTPGISREGLATVVGNLPLVNPGEYLTLAGQWEKHPTHGMQFSVDTCQQNYPVTTDGIRRYLGSGLIKGIGRRMADRIVDRFGEETLDVIEKRPDRLMEVKDIGAKRVQQIVTAWNDQKQVKEIMLYLHSHAVSTNLAVKIYKQYGNESLAVVKSDPYRLARDVHGIGFRTADKLAQALGLPHDHPSRIDAGLVYALNQMVEDGHVYSPQAELVDRTVELLGVKSEAIQPALDRLRIDDRIIIDRAILPPGENGEPQLAVYLTPFFLGEKMVAERIKQLISALPSRLNGFQNELPGADTVSMLGANLSEQQLDAVRTALTSPVSVLTGGPGTGKTTTIRTLIKVLEAHHKRYALVSPTGRAAKRLSESTGRGASTIHRMLGYAPDKGFQHDSGDPLQVDMLVVDEASMLDLLLTNHLLKAVEPGTHLLLVGDVDQLPSVGAGDVLRDIIGSEQVPVSRLTQIYRQAGNSQIITNAHRINQGEQPIFAADNRDFFLFPASTANDSAQWVEDVVCDRIPRKFGYDPFNDIQVLAPIYRGQAGVDALNSRLQARLNPPQPLKPEQQLFGQLFRQGDRVMQTQNNYDKETFNGDIGRIKRMINDDHTLEIDFEGKVVEYDWSEADQLTLAYAVSVHKAQGSEFPVIVMPMVMQHYLMLQRNLFYTAVTRAKRLCVLVGEKRAIQTAVSNNKTVNRYTALDLRLNKK